MILVVGATGLLGGQIARQLLGQGRAVRVLVRDTSAAEAVEGLRAAGADTVRGDLKDEPSLRAACAGIDTVVTTASSMGRGGEDTLESVDLNGNLHLVDAAEAERVGHVVFVSALGAAPGHPMPLLNAKGATEQRLRASSMSWTVLQPDVFMDLLIPAVVGVPALSGQPVTLVGTGRRRHAMVSARDVAACAVAAVDHPQARRQTVLVGGPQAVTWLDVVAAFERAIGRDLERRTVPPGEPLDGMPAVVGEVLAALDGYDSPLETEQVARTYGVTQTSVADFVQEWLAAQSSARPDEAPSVAGRGA